MAEEKKKSGGMSVGVLIGLAIFGGLFCHAVSQEDTSERRPRGLVGTTAVAVSGVKSLVGMDSAPAPVLQPSGYSAHSQAPREVYVQGYYRSNGTYVPPHYRTAADGDPSNNWSTYGNVNPHTGKPGTRPSR